MDWLKAKVVGLMGIDYVQLLLLLMIFNTGISMLTNIVDILIKWLESFMNETETDLDNKAFTVLQKVRVLLAKGLGILNKLVKLVGSKK